MVKGRCIGLIGGLGVGAAVHYYSSLAQRHKERGISLDLVMAHADVGRGFAYMQAGDRDGLANYLNGFMHRLKAAGAEVAVIPAVTPHSCVRELLAISPLPLLSIFDPLAEELSARSIQKVAVFGTRFVVESGLFGMVHGVEIVRPTPEEVEYIHDTYMELVDHGEASEERCRGLTNLALTLCRRDGVEAIVLAGTDFASMFNTDKTNFPHLDCAALHLRAIMNSLCEGMPLDGF